MIFWVDFLGAGKYIWAIFLSISHRGLVISSRLEVESRQNFRVRGRFEAKCFEFGLFAGRVDTIFGSFYSKLVKINVKK